MGQSRDEKGWVPPPPPPTTFWNITVVTMTSLLNTKQSYSLWKKLKFLSAAEMKFHMDIFGTFHFSLHAHRLTMSRENLEVPLHFRQFIRLNNACFLYCQSRNMNDLVVFEFIIKLSPWKSDNQFCIWMCDWSSMNEWPFMKEYSPPPFNTSRSHFHRKTKIWHLLPCCY